MHEFPLPPNDDVRDDYPSLDIVLDLTKEQIQSQLSQHNSLDGKAGFVLGSASILTGVLLAWHPPTAQITFPRSVFLQGLPIIAIGTYLFLVAFSYKAYSLRSLREVGEPSVLISSYLRLPEKLTKATVLSTMSVAYQLNQKALQAKIRWVRAALIALLFEVVVIGLLLAATFAL